MRLNVFKDKALRAVLQRSLLDWQTARESVFQTQRPEGRWERRNGTKEAVRDKPGLSQRKEQRKRGRYVGRDPVVPHSIQRHSEPPCHAASGVKCCLCAGFLPTTKVSHYNNRCHFSTCGLMLPSIPSQPRGHLGTFLPLQIWKNLVMSNTVTTQGKKCFLATWEWVCPSVQRRQKKCPKFQERGVWEGTREWRKGCISSCS